MQPRLSLGAVGALGAIALFAREGHAEAPSNERTDYTAYTRPGGRVAAGPLKLEFGLIDEITIGTYVPPWFAFPVLGVPIPNAYLKLRSWWGGPVAWAVRGGVLHIDGEGVAQLIDEDASAGVTALAAEVDATLHLNDSFSFSLGLDYAHLHATGDAEDSATSIEGASTADTWSARLFTEWHLSSVTALTLLLRYVAYQSPVGADVTVEEPAYTVDSDLSAESTATHRRGTVVPGVAFNWEHWELSAGLGLGVFPVPALGITTTRILPVFDFAFAFLFDLY